MEDAMEAESDKDEVGAASQGANESSAKRHSRADPSSAESDEDDAAPYKADESAAKRPSQAGPVSAESQPFLNKRQNCLPSAIREYCARA